MNSPCAFVAGWPIKHSRSPLIHRFWLECYDLSGSYEPVALPPEAAAPFFASLRERGFSGGNVTIPHKEAAFAAALRRDKAAEAIGAVNTLWFEGETLVGGNTDAFGFAANLDERAPGWSAAECALVLGAGGAARAVVHALLERGIARVLVLNRTVSRAERLAEEFGTRVVAAGNDDLRRLLSAADILVNATPAGMAGGSEGEGEEPPDLSHLPDHAIVSDIVYVPLETPFLRAAKARGLRTVDGLGMLLHQAAPGFERWFGRRPEVTVELRDLVLRDVEGR